MDTSEKDFETGIFTYGYFRKGLRNRNIHLSGRPRIHPPRASQLRPRSLPRSRRALPVPLRHPGQDLGEAETPARRSGQGTLPQASVRSDRKARHPRRPAQGRGRPGLPLRSRLLPPREHPQRRARPPARGQHHGRDAASPLQREERQQSRLGPLCQRAARHHRRIEDAAQGPNRAGGRGAVQIRTRSRRAAVCLPALPCALRRGHRPRVHDHPPPGRKEWFLPFNKGHDRAAGNPPNPNGFKTAYLWEEVWRRDALLEILNHFLVDRDKIDENGKKTGEREVIFPRYHQLDAVRRLVAHARQNGTGQNYLVEHSAGSGKSNSIAWLCHRLVGLHDANDQRVFDSVVVVTDRRVLDQQLRSTIRSFEQVKGIVTAIEKHKSQELAEALMGGKDIIITTLQTFPFVTEKIGEMPGHRFAVVVDEAHSSQSGETQRKMKEVLTASSLEEAAKEEAAAQSDEEDAVNAAVEAAMRRRGRLRNVSFFAFTATPKAKTLELFNTPDPGTGRPPFSLYPMRQAIEEGFILDVLQNYTTFRVYFSLLKKIEADPQYDRKKATYLLRSYADLHAHAIHTKSAMILDHFEGEVKNRIGGQAKAMVVTRSRLHAVRYKLEFDREIKKRRLPYKVLVAFSGEVKDPESGQTFTEAGMNGFSDSQTAANFKSKGCRLLVRTEPTDPNKLYDRKRTVEDHHLFGADEVEDFARVYFSVKGKAEQLQPLLDSVVDRYELRSKDERPDIRKHVGDYVRLYAFLSQVITFSDAGLEKFYQFTRHLLRKLKLPDDPLPVEITKNINMDSYRIQQTSSGAINLMDEDGQLKPISALGTGRPPQGDLAPLSEIVEYINDHFGTDFTHADKVKFFAENMGRRLEDREGLRRALDAGVNPSEETRKLAFDTFFGDTLEDMIDSDFDIYKKIKDDPNFGALFRAVMYRRIAAALQSRAAPI